MGNEIVKSGFLAPVVSVNDALMAYQAKKDLIDGIMRKDVDFGVIPGTNKPTLLKAGAEKATSFFGLSPRFHDSKVIEDWTGKEHDGEPFFYYRRTCNLYQGEYLVASVDGSCNSWEKKYRYRDATRVCPKCHKPAIVKGKEEYGGGWLCYKKKDGCGAKFADNAPEIINQESGQVRNPDITDLPNTILKMADKRALIAATLIATGLSEYFTQDTEDFIQPGVTDFVEGVATPVANGDAKKSNGHSNGNPDPIEESLWTAFLALCHRAEKVNVSYNMPNRETTLKADLQTYMQELSGYVRDAERQATAA